MALDVPIYNNTTPQSNVTLFSEDIARDYLDTLQEKTTLTMIPAIIFLIILAVVGMFGNSLTLLVYWWKIKISPTNILLMLIAVFDLLTNVLVTPGEVYRMLNLFQYDNAVLCTVYHYFLVFTNIASGASLTVVASIRYRKVCKPFSRQMSIKEARYASFFVVGMAAIFAIPNAVVYGIELKETDREGILAHQCSVDNRYVDTIWPMLYQIILLLLFIICFIPLVVFSVLIVIRAWKFSRRRFTFPDSVCVSASTMGKKNGIAKSVFSIAQPSQMSESVSSDHETVISSSTSEQGTIPKGQGTIPSSSTSGQGRKPSSSTSEQGMISNSSTSRHGTTSSGPFSKSKLSTVSPHDKCLQFKSKQREKIFSRTTLSLLVINGVCILTYVPYFALSFPLMYGGTSNMTLAQAMFFELFLRSVVLNSATNPIIYSLCNINFRRSCMELLKCKH